MLSICRQGKTVNSMNAPKERISLYDTIIIGGGVIGSLISFRLSKYQFSTALLEKEADLAMEESGANSAIVHAGYDPEPGSKKAFYNILGNREMEPLCQQLQVPFRRNGSLVLAFNREEEDQLRRLLERGKTNGVPDLVLLSRNELLKLEPAVSKESVCALYAPTGGIVCPYELTLAAGETACRNGVDFYFEHEVTKIQKGNDGLFTVSCHIPDPDNLKSFLTQTFQCRFLINASGAYADKVSAMAGDASFTITPRRGEYLVMDKMVGNLVQHTIFQAPSVKGKGVLVTPSVDGNLLIGPNAQVVGDPSDKRTTAAGMQEIWELARKSVPSIDKRWIIRSFSGIRSTPSTHDFIIQESDAVPGFFQVSGIESPGLTAAPAISSEVERLVTEAFPMKPELKEQYIQTREAIVRFRDLSLTEQQQKIQEDPQYAHVVCRCEKVTEAEIVDAIRRPLGAKTLNGVKMRTRAGMGRCQSGFCLPKVLEILSRERGIAEEAVTLSGTGSELITGKTR